MTNLSKAELKTLISELEQKLNQAKNKMLPQAMRHLLCT